MTVQSFQPGILLRPYIDRYWSWSYNGHDSIPMPQVAPGVGMDFFIHFQDPFSMTLKGRLPYSHLIYSTQQSSALLPASNIGFIAIRFRAGMFKNFTAIPLYELEDQFAGAVEIWGPAGNHLIQQLNEIPALPDKVVVLEQFLMQMLMQFEKQDPAWTSVITHLYHQAASTTLDQLAASTGMSYRHFRRRFKIETGMTPKHFQQLARFHATLKYLLLQKQKGYLSAALGNGYYDQMHFIKAFKYFMNVTPTRFLQEKNFMSHFYYPRL